MRILWDEPKRETNRKTHGLDFVDARDRFDFRSAMIEGTYPGADNRARFIALAPMDGRIVAVVFSLLGSEALSIISFRAASKKERKRYDQG